MNYYQRHLGDYAKDTGHLSMLEHGAYTLLLDRYYSTERGIPADDAYRHARARTKEEKAAVDAVLHEFLTLVDGVWTKRRVEQEIEKASRRAMAARENGKNGGRRKGQPKAEPKEDPKENPKTTQKEPSGFHVGSPAESGRKTPITPITNTSVPSAKASGTASPPTLTAKDRVWSLGPALLGERGRSLLGQLVAKHGEGVVADALDAAAKEQPGEPKAWLVKACEAGAKRRAEGDMRGDEACPAWVLEAGFSNRWEAENEGCYAHNAAQFRGGKRQEVVA